MGKSTVIFIPSRYASVRYPGKSLAELRGATGQSRSLMERCWLAAKSVAGIDAVYVVTDDTRIQAAAEGFGAKVLMTSSSCRNGTERCAEATGLLDTTPDFIVNLQGDAPLTPSWYVEDLLTAMQADKIDVATPVLRCSAKHLKQLKDDRLSGRIGGTTAVFDHSQNALYFSKEVIPYTAKDYGPDEQTPVFHHVGVYAYTPASLNRYNALPVGKFEMLEGLEQLRFVENGTPVRCVEVESRGREFWELNNPSDIATIEAIMRAEGIE